MGQTLFGWDGKSKNTLRTGAWEEIRTPDLRITSALLYRLSYPGTLEVHPSVDPGTVRSPTPPRWVAQLQAAPSWHAALGAPPGRGLQLPGGDPPVRLESRPEVLLVIGGERREGGVTPCPPEHRVTVDPVGTELLVHEGTGEDLVGWRARERATEPHETRLPLRTQVGLRVEPLGEGRPVEVGAVPQDECHHDLIARVGVGHAVDRRH